MTMHKIPEERVPRIRPTFEELYMGFAHNIRMRSSCYRMAVGAVITSVDYRYVYALGYNGNAEGLENGCDSTEVGNCGCLHAEENATINCTVARDVAKVAFVTHLPCKMCAKRLIHLGNVKRIYYAFDYRDRASLEIFEKKGIETCHLPVASSIDEMAIYKAAEHFYEESVVKRGLEDSLIGSDKPFATPFAYQMHLVINWRNAVKSDMNQILTDQAATGSTFIASLKEKISARYSINLVSA